MKALPTLGVSVTGYSDPVDGGNGGPFGVGDGEVQVGWKGRSADGPHGPDVAIAGPFAAVDPDVSAAIDAEDSSSGTVKVSYGKDSSAVDFRRGIQELAFQWGSGGCRSLLEHQNGGGFCFFWVFKVCVMATTVVARRTTSSATSAKS